MADLILLVISILVVIWAIRAERRRGKGCCIDCGRKYGDEYGFPDLLVPNNVWAKISPTGDEGGLLCPSCMCRRAHDHGLTNVAARFVSGPFAMQEDDDDAACIKCGYGYGTCICPASDAGVGDGEPQYIGGSISSHLEAKLSTPSPSPGVGELCERLHRLGCKANGCELTRYEAAHALKQQAGEIERLKSLCCQP